MPNIKYRDTDGYFADLIDMLDYYPIGSIYMSYEDTSPAEMFGGEWEQIKNKFLYASTNTNTGGASSHKHYVPIYIDRPNYDTGQIRLIAWHDANEGPIHGEYIEYNAQAHQLMFHYKANTSIVDGNTYTTPALNMYSQTVSSMPPYQSVYCWRRVS